MIILSAMKNLVALIRRMDASAMLGLFCVLYQCFWSKTRKNLTMFRLFLHLRLDLLKHKRNILK